jgi:AcrR family transcriptional regulator
MDAVEDLMREEGYAALSARSVAKRAGLKYQIVFYYFQTMDDLLLSTYQRRTDALSKRVVSAVHSVMPLHEIWKSLIGDDDGVLSLEYMAMSNHNAAIRIETVRFGEQMRRLIAATLSAPTDRSKSADNNLSPLGVTWILNAIICLLSFESALGLSGGHRDVVAMVEAFLDKIEPESGSLGSAAEAATVVEIVSRPALAAKRSRATAGR